MGASVGIGALIVGTSLMLVFALAVQSLDNRMETSLEIIDDAGEPIPSFQIDDATLWEGAVLTVAITTNGSGYQDGTLVEQSGSGGFSGTFTVDAAGGIETVTITNRGITRPLLQLSLTHQVNRLLQQVQHSHQI